MMRCFMGLMMAGLLAVLGCGQKPAEPTLPKVTSDDVRRDVGQAINTAAEFSQQTKDEFQKKLEARLQEVDAEYAKLREQGRDLKDEAKIRWDEKMADLETKRDAARVKLAEVGNSTAEAWKDVQQGAESAWKELDKSFREAASEF